MADALRDLFHVAGDYPDPAGTGLRGVAPGYRLSRTAIGNPVVFYHDLVLTIDVYHFPPEPLFLHLICPKCMAIGQKKNALTVHADRKHIEYDRQAPVPTPPGWSKEQLAHTFPEGLGGLLSIEEPIACCWGGALGDNQANRCTWRVVIANNVARDV